MRMNNRFLRTIKIHRHTWNYMEMHVTTRSAIYTHCPRILQPDYTHFMGVGAAIPLNGTV